MSATGVYGGTRIGVDGHAIVVQTAKSARGIGIIGERTTRETGGNAGGTITTKTKTTNGGGCRDAEPTRTKVVDIVVTENRLPLGSGIVRTRTRNASVSFRQIADAQLPTTTKMPIDILDLAGRRRRRRGKKRRSLLGGASF
jgi:hypothetical protein